MIKSIVIAVCLALCAISAPVMASPNHVIVQTDNHALPAEPTSISEELALITPAVVLPKRCSRVLITRKFQDLNGITNTRAAPAVVALRVTCG